MDADNTFISHSQRIIIQPKWIGSSVRSMGVSLGLQTVATLFIIPHVF